MQRPERFRCFTNQSLSWFDRVSSRETMGTKILTKNESRSQTPITSRIPPPLNRIVYVQSNKQKCLTT